MPDWFRETSSGQDEKPVTRSRSREPAELRQRDRGGAGMGMLVAALLILSGCDEPLGVDHLFFLGQDAEDADWRLTRHRLEEPFGERSP